MDSNSLWEELIFEVGTVIRVTGNSDDRITVGSGNRQGSIMFIGDDSNLYLNEKLGVAPGSSGEFLVKLCDVSEIHPDDYYITTLTKSDIKYKDYFDNKQESLKELLEMQIALVNPKLIVALGERVASVLLNSEIDFNRERGRIKDFAGDMKLLITFDPFFAKQARENVGKSSSVANEFWNDLKTISNYIKEL